MPEESAARGRGFVRAPRELLAGASLVAIAAFALRATASLDAGTLRALGPGMLPRAVAIAVGALGLAVAARGLVRRGPPLGRWRLRGPLFVTLGVVAFALTIRSLGLAVAGPLVVLVSGFASPESRARELVLFALALTAACVGLFRYALGLPIPVLVLPGVVTL
jgi:putative tricarboxylic transport membrane protein